MPTRRIETADLSTCAGIFNEAFNDVHHSYGFEEDVVDEDDSWLLKPLGHFLTTDPEGCLIVSDDDGDVAFGASLRRDDYLFLAFLFVRPRGQGAGIGRELLHQLMDERPGATHATMVESFQATATGLYASEGMVPSAVKYWLTASRDRLEPAPAADLSRRPLTEDDLGAIDELDRSVLGFARPADHRWWMGSMRGYTYLARDRIVGYAYVDDGWISPALAVDEPTLVSLFLDVIGTVEKDEVETAVLGSSGTLFQTLVRSGFRVGVSRYTSVYASTNGSLPASYVLHADWLP